MTMRRYADWFGQLTSLLIAAGHAGSLPVCHSVLTVFTKLIILGTISTCSAAILEEYATVEMKMS